MKKLNMFIRAASLGLSIIILSVCLYVPSFAYSYTDSSKSSTSIAPTKKQFSSAEKPLYSKSSQTIYDSVSSKYSVDIYHYEAPKSGYYQIYTTGTTDTLGKVYEENSTLWFNIRYDQKANNDDSGDGLNFKMVTEFDEDEDYYICARGYASRTGSYTLSIKPNDDAVYSKVGGVWTNKDLGITGVESKTYYTAAQAKVYYQMLRNKQTQNLIKNYYTKNGTIGTHQALLEAGATTFEIVNAALAIAECAGVISSSINPVVGAAVMITSAALSVLFESFYEDVDTISEIMAELQKRCGCGYTVSYNRDIYKTPTNGICITTHKKLLGIRENTYAAYSSTTLYGEKYCSGTWNKNKI